MGVLMLILPARRSASFSLTMVYDMVVLVVRLVISTFVSIWTLSVLRREVSTTFASLMVAFSLFILSSR